MIYRRQDRGRIVVFATFFGRVAVVVILGLILVPVLLTDEREEASKSFLARSIITKIQGD